MPQDPQMQLHDFCVQANIVVVDPSTIIDRGEIVFKRGVVSEVRAGWRDENAVRLPNMAIVPGLVNCHTHLEFSYLERPFPALDGFPDWISQVVASRRSIESEMDESAFRSFRQNAIRAGERELSDTGTALACDIVTAPWESEYLDRSGTTIIPAFEFIGMEASRLQSSFEWAAALSGRTKSDFLAAISPHSPYSLMFPKAAELLTTLPRDRITAMHLAESQEEMEWLTERRGPFKNAFERIGVPIPEELPSIDDCLKLVLDSRHALIVHGNYLNAAQLKRIGESPQATLVVCPRTHTHFRHATFPVQKALDAGVRVTLGTDSRASNPDLSLWLEMSELRRKLPELDACTVYAMATTTAAESLGVDNQYGKIGLTVAAKNLWALPLGGLGRNDILEHMTTLEKSPQMTPLLHCVQSTAG